MFNHDLDDDLDGLFGGAAHARPVANDPLIEAVVAHATRQVWRENCPKCRGTGTYRAPSQHGHKCFECNGVGYKEFKTAPDVRKQYRDRAAAKRNERAQQVSTDAAQWINDHPAAHGWLVKAASRDFEFAASMLDTLSRYGRFTEGQQAAIDRCVEKSILQQRVWDAERAARVEQAPAVSIAAIETSLATAKGNGLKAPKLRLADFVFSLAGSNSVNAGSIYVKDNRGEYLGKITGGKLLAVRTCDEETKRSILEVAADPKQAAIAYGKQYGTCACCGRDLTDPASVALGIGPVCASKWGW